MVAVAGTPTTGAKAFVFKANQKVWPPELSGPSHWINSVVKAVPSLKTPSAFHHNLTPIVCVGESLEQRESGHTLDWITSQLKGALIDVPKEQVSQLIVAYEPIWAIGTGKTATADQAEEVCKEIRDYIRSLYDDETADAVRIQYGGSVKSENALEILGEPNIDGALVGGASLVVDEFIDIIKAANQISA